MDRTRLRGWLALGLLGLGAVVAACSEEFTGLKRLLPTDPSRHEVWPASNPPYQCRIGLKTTNLQTLSGIPTVDTVCSTIVTMSWPAFQDPAIPQQEHTFWWLHSEPGPWPPKVTGYGTGSFNDKLNGPITYTFSRKISRFSIHMQQIDSVGHYMEAFDSAGVRLDSVPFGPGQGSFKSDIRELADTLQRIVRVLIHAPLNGPNGFGDFSPKDNVVRQASFEFECDTVGIPPELQNKFVRPILFSGLESGLADPQMRERAGGIYKDTSDTSGKTWLGHEGPITNNTPCASGYAANLNPPFDIKFNWHTHILTPPMLTTPACDGYPVGTPVAAGPSGCANLQNPANPCDFAAADTSGRPHYIISRDFLYRIQPNAANHATGNYEKRWKINRETKCFGPAVP